MTDQNRRCSFFASSCLNFGRARYAALQYPNTLMKSVSDRWSSRAWKKEKEKEKEKEEVRCMSRRWGGVHRHNITCSARQFAHRHPHIRTRMRMHTPEGKHLLAKPLQTPKL